MANTERSSLCPSLGRVHDESDVDGNRDDDDDDGGRTGDSFGKSVAVGSERNAFDAAFDR